MAITAPRAPLEHQTGADPRASVIVMHGLGADATDFQPFVREVDLASVGAVRWIFPYAPQQPVTLNAGYVMPAWYDIYGGLERMTREDEAGLRASQALIDAIIDREVARGIPASRIVLGGFSQGCAMALMTGLRYPQRLAGLLGMSGYLPIAGKLAAERHSANHDVPIFLAHGTQDPMIDIARARASRDMLQGLGYDVEWHEYPMPHSVCMEEVEDVRGFVARVLGALD